MIMQDLPNSGQDAPLETSDSGDMDYDALLSGVEEGSSSVFDLFPNYEAVYEEYLESFIPGFESESLRHAQATVESAAPSVNGFPITSPPLAQNAASTTPIQMDFKFIKNEHSRKRKPSNSKPGRPPGLSPEEREQVISSIRRRQEYRLPWSLDDLMTDIKVLHDLQVGQSAARGIQKDMRIVKNKRSASKSASQAQPNNETRERVAKSLPIRSGPSKLSLSEPTKRDENGLTIQKRFTPEQFRNLEHMLHLVSNYVKCHLDTSKRGWSWNDLGISFEGETKDYSDLWKAIADQCHGASSLIQTKHQLKAYKTIQGVYQKFTIVAQQHDPWIIIYLWKILLYINGISNRLNPPNAPFIKRFINYLGGLYFTTYNTSICLVPLLSLLAKVPLNKMKITIQLLYKRTIFEFEKFEVTRQHPEILRMWSHFHSHSKNQFREEALGIYQSLYKQICKKPGMNPEYLMVISEYMLIACNERDNLMLTKHLAEDILHRTRGYPLQTWDRITYSSVVASKYLARVLWQQNDHENCWQPLRSVVNELMHGDRECRTRAVQILETLARRYAITDNLEQAGLQRDIAGQIRDTIKEWPAHRSPWAESTAYHAELEP